MKSLLVCEGEREQVFRLSDPDAESESVFEFAVARALSRVFASYRCIVFNGTFRLDGRGYRPDLALIAKDFSHWFVIEVELVAHSLEGHVLPQVRAFRYGSPQADCVTILARELDIGVAQASTLVELVPRAVAVVANKRDPHWESTLRTLDVQLLNVDVFKLDGTRMVYAIEGYLLVLKESLGFGTYSATDRSLRFAKSTRLPIGKVQVEYPSGVPSLWDVRIGEDGVWLTKEIGTPDIPDGVYVQVVKTVDGRLSLLWPVL